MTTKQATKPDFKALFESLPGLYLILSPDFTIVAASDAALYAGKKERNEAIGRNIFEVFPENKAEEGAAGEGNLTDSLNRVLQTKCSDTMALQKYDIINEYGEYEKRYWSIKNSPILDENCSVIYIIHHFEDVTAYVKLSQNKNQEHTAAKEHRIQTKNMEMEIVKRSIDLQDSNKRLRQMTSDLKNANGQLEMQTEKLQEIDKLKSQFLAMASHELKAPLTVISGFAATMMQRWDELPDAQKLSFIEIIDNQSNRLNHLINELLTLSMVESGKLKTHCVELNVAKTVEKVVHDLHAEDHVVIENCVNCNVIADEDYFTQIMVNYISNAQKYGQDPIEVSAHNEGDFVEVAVADHGEGIPKELEAHLFESFSRLPHNSSMATGTGLGLSIVKGLAVAQGGDAWYEPNKPHGAIFKARLPKASI